MTHVHLIGIGGIGVSALARAYKNLGYTISGSDPSSSDLTKDLEKEGMQLFYEHKGENLPKETDFVIYTEAISDDNPELVEAKKRDIPVMTYFKGLGELTKEKYTIAVAGTHGKTTTTGIMALCLIEGGLDPSVIVGSKMKEFGNKNFRAGKSDYVVLEACEYRGSFLSLYPNIVLLTNCEVDHLDYYRDEEHYHETFISFIQSIPKDGYLILHTHDEKSQKVAQHANCNVIEVSPDIKIPKLSVPGEHNVENARLAYIASQILEIDDEKIEQGLKNFKGTWRRFEKIGEKNGVMVIDDYGHHPTEIKATLKGAREKYPNNRIICVYQPHQYSRTRFFLEEFKTAFKDADIVIIPNIYEARDTEEDKKAMSPEILTEKIKEGGTEVYFTGDFEKSKQLLNTLTQPEDIVITMGAGDVWKIGPMFLGK